jgi:hypothetical protein
MFQCLIAFFNEVGPFLNTSMASSIASLVHLPVVIRRLHLLTLVSFLTNFYPKDGGTIYLSWFGSFEEFTLLPMKHTDHHDLNPLSPNPTSNRLGVCYLAL